MSPFLWHFVLYVLLARGCICADTAGPGWTIRLMETDKFKTPTRINLHITAIFFSNYTLMTAAVAHKQPQMWVQTCVFSINATSTVTAAKTTMVFSLGAKDLRLPGNGKILRWNLKINHYFLEQCLYVIIIKTEIIKIWQLLPDSYYFKQINCNESFRLD